MAIEVRTVGGYGEIGKNMTAVKVDDEVILIDMGLHLPNYITVTEEEEVLKISKEQLIDAQAVPDDSIIDDWKEKVKAIVPSHAHLDHIGAIPYLASKYNAPIIASPFTAEVIRRILEDEKIRIPNKLISADMNTLMKITPNISLELFEITHSTPHSCLIILHTKYGAIIYANDFKLDGSPILGKKPNYARLEKIGKEGVILLICECLYSADEGKTPSENVAKTMLEEVLLNVDSRGKLILTTTFSSHIARLKSIVECARKLNRRPVFLGRSLSKYCEAAIACGIYDFKGVEMMRYPKQIARVLTDVDKKRDKYMVVATGHQGEPKSVLHRITHGALKFRLKPEDHVVFSCKIIPTDINRANRKELEDDLRQAGVRIFKDIHVSGHASKEDLRDFLKYLSPQHCIPSHGAEDMMTTFQRLGDEMGYKVGQTLHVLRNGETLRLS